MIRLKSQTSPNDYPIDFVVLWVDGSDPKWLKKKKHYNAEFDIANAEARYRNWGIFKYWFRAIEEYAPWVNHVYLVTDEQKPEWLNEDNPKLTIVDHKDIIDDKNLPTFNSQAIEMNLHKIPGLSEHFVYFNDDMFLINKTKKENFFVKGLPRGIANINAATGMEGDQLYARAMFNNILLINRHFKKKEIVNKHIFKWLNPKYGSFNLRTLTQIPYPYFTGYKPCHMPSSLLVSTMNEVWAKEYAVLDATSSHRFRHRDDVNQDVFSQWQICKNQFMPQRKSSGKLIQLKNIDDIETIAHTLHVRKTKFLCVNDGPSVAVEKTTMAKMKKRMVEVFDNKYPEKSSYEK